MHFIVLEGPDAAGKTTLAKALCNRLGFLYHHEGPEPGLDERELLDRYLALPAMLEEATTGYSRGKGAVIDRLATSERVYAAAMNRADRLGPIGELRVRQKLASAGPALWVMCLPPLSVCLTDMNRRGDDLINATILRKVWTAYSLLDGRPGWDYRYDRTRENALDYAVEWAVREIR